MERENNQKGEGKQAKRRTKTRNRKNKTSRRIEGKHTVQKEKKKLIKGKQTKKADWDCIEVNRYREK